jgi:protein phosphatase
VIKEKFSQHLITENNFEEDMLVLIRDISARLNRMAAEKGQLRPMGCTLTGVVWHYGHAWLINAGDSRTYRFRGGILGQLTTDETERGVTGNPNASKLLLNCIGGGCEGYLTVTSLDDRLFENDVLLICSDGLSDMVSEEQIETAIGAGATAADLYRMACEGGGVDNVSVILARLS